MSLRGDLVKVREQWIAKLCAELVEAVGGHPALEPVGIAPEMGEALLARALVVGRIAALVANGSSPSDIATLLAAGGAFAGSGSRPEQLTDLVDKVHCRVGFNGITGSVGFLGYGLRAWSPESTYLLLLELWAARRLGAASAARVKRELTGIWGVRDPGWLDACLSRPVDPLQGYPDLWTTLKAEPDVRVANVAAVAFGGNATSKAWQQWADRLPSSLSRAEHVLEVGGDLVRATRARRLLRRRHDEADADLRSVMARALVIIEDHLERVNRAVTGLSTLERELLRERTAEEYFQDSCLAELADRSYTLTAIASWYDAPCTTHGMWGPLPWWTMTVRGRDQEQAAAATLAEGALPLGFHRDPAAPDRLELICRRPRTGSPGLRAHFMFDLTNPADVGELLMIGRRGGICIDVHNAIDDEYDDQTVIQMGTLSVAAGPELARMLTDIASKALKELLPPVDRDQDACEPRIPALGQALQQVGRRLLGPWSTARELLGTELDRAGSGIALETTDPPTTMDRFVTAEKRRARRPAKFAAPQPLRAPYENGFVYVQRNPALGEMLKIGYSQRLPEDRADELSCTPVPFAYEVVHRVVTSRAQDVEQAVHRLLAAQRVAPNREFFRVSQETAEDAIRYCQELVTGVGSWDPLPEVHRLRAGDRVTLPLKAGQVFVTTAYSHWLAPSAEIMDIWQAHADGDVLELFLTSDPEPVRGLSDNDPGADEDPVPFLNRDNSAHNGALIGQERLVAGDRLIWLSDQDDPDSLSGSAVFEIQDFCQVTCRTWNPQLGPHGLPLLLNDVTRAVSPAIAKGVQAVLHLDGPDTWAPRDAGWERSETRGTRPEEWLPQLRQRQRHR